VPYYTLKWSTSFSFLEGRLIAPAGMLYGLLLLVVVFVLPGGVIDGIRRVRSRIVRVVPNPSWLPTPNSVKAGDGSARADGEKATRTWRSTSVIATGDQASRSSGGTAP
jgi:hypothetical protein